MGKYPVPYDEQVDKHIMERRRARIEGLTEGLEKEEMQIKLEDPYNLTQNP